MAAGIPRRSQIKIGEGVFEANCVAFTYDPSVGDDWFRYAGGGEGLSLTLDHDTGHYFYERRFANGLVEMGFSARRQDVDRQPQR